jgi:hypothetical protein
MVRSVARKCDASRTIEARVAAHPSRRPRYARAPQDEVEFVARSQCQTANAPPARVLLRRRVRLSFPSPDTRGSGAPTGASTNSRHACEPTCTAGFMRSGVDIPARDAAPSGAPLAAILGLGTVLPGTDGAFSRLRAAPLHLPRRLSPPFAVPRPAIEGSPT